MWLNYFDQSLSRKYGRKLSKSLTVPEPKLSEVVRACELLGYRYEVEDKKYPRTWYRPSAQIVLKVPSTASKYEVIKQLGRKLVEVRLKHQLAQRAS
ncbi:MAG: signal recognition particle subunit SRP19/SEC65 family protein [Sulfolobales archaeon]|nr:signal recognition particle subunit SRP19/SEC65 family protein [Sulfolobales archaeon]